MKKILSVFLSVLIIFSVCTCFSVSAASVYKEFDLSDKTYHNYTYTDDHNYNKFTLSKSGVVTVYPGSYSTVNKSTNVKKEEYYYIYVYSYNGSQLTQLYYRSVSPENTEKYFLFLDAGTYVVDFKISYNTYYSHIIENYGMTFMESKFNGHTRNASTSVYNGYIRETSGTTCYNQVTAKEDTRIEVTFNLPIKMDGTRYGTYLVLEKKSGSTWVEYSNKYYYESEYPVDKAAVATINVSKGTYRFYFDTSGAYQDIQKYSEVTYVKYKSKVTAASKLSVAKPTLTQTTTYSSNYSTTRKLTVNYNQYYDGVELWVKSNKGKYVKKSTCELKYNNQYATFTLYLDYPNNNKYFYKVRAYTLYGTNKKYSSYSDVRYSRSSGVKQPSVTLSNDSRKITVSYKKLSGVSGYEIYRSTKKSSGFTMVKRTTSTKYTTGKLTKNKKYYFKVRAYKTINGERIYGKYSSVKSITAKDVAAVKTPTITLKNKSRKITVSYKKLSGVSGYEIYRSTKKSSGYSMVKRTTSTKYTTGKLTKNKKYYFKVRAYKTVKGKRTYGKYSSVKSITAK